MIMILCVAALVWLLVGGIICLCGMEFTDVKPTLPMIIVVLIVGPFAINKGMVDL